VAGHSYGLWEIDSFDYSRFVAKKTRNVLVPYLILSLAGIGLYLLGINCAIHRDEVIEFVSGRVLLLGSLCIAWSARLVLRRYSRVVLGW
jgi:hypothetical protein